MRVYEGKLIGSGMRFGLVVSRWNDLVTQRLLEGAVGALRAHGVEEEALEVVWVPGSFELPLLARQMARSGRYEAVVALGCLIRGLPITTP